MTLKGFVSAIVGAAVILTVATPSLHAQVIDNKDQRKCIETIAKEGGKYVNARLKELGKCADKNLKSTGSCDLIKRNAKLAKAESKLKAGIDKKCGDASKLPSPDLALTLLGFPGKCPDSTGPPFTNDDLETCIFETHRDIADLLFDRQYGDNGDDAVLSFEDQGNDATTAKDLGKCQKEIGKNAGKFVKTILKEVQKCRNGLQSGKTTGFLPTNCADNLVEPKPGEKIAKTETKVRDKIAGKCTNGLLALMDVCDTGGGAQVTVGTVQDCIVDEHRNACDNPDQGAAADLIDIEYRQAASCGDNIQNDPAVGGLGNFVIAPAPEECDGTDDVDCPGQCGAPGSNFACLCEDIPRMRVVEKGTINGDNGWNGIAHDQAIVGGSGHVLDLYDCDGPGGPDTVCTVGPSCALAPNGPCSDDGDCAGGGNFCRKRPTATGPHCNADVQQTCSLLADCSGLPDFCRKTAASTPIPSSAGGVSTCTVNLLEEDIVGTVDVATGAGSVRLRQKAVTHLDGSTEQPCPLCGGFCANADPNPALRTPCDADSDCPASVTCVTDFVCSFGPNADSPCRPDPPFGGTNPQFGTTSIDCQPNSGTDISSGGLDITTDPRTTGTATLPPSFSCTASGFGGNVCIAGADTGKSCGADTDCSGGGAGSCSPQCFCAAIGGIPTAPNACNAACRGGTNDYLPCNGDSDCPGGFCQEASCRLAQGICIVGANQGLPCTGDSDCAGGKCDDLDSTQEGFCPGGPIDQICSFTSFKSCTSDLGCRPASVGGTCPFCQTTETCVTQNRQCFLNEGISRSGSPGLPTRSRASAFCIPASGNSSVNNGGGFPGPGTTEGEEDVFFTGF